MTDFADLIKRTERSSLPMREISCISIVQLQPKKS